MFKIRHMENSDFDQLYKMGEHFCIDNPHLKEIGWDRDSTRNLLSLITSSDNIVGLTVEKETELVGMIVTVISPHMFNNQILVADEVAWWVEPEYRTLVANTLLQTTEDLLKDMGVKYLYMKYLHAEVFSPKLMERFYRNKGYEKIESSVRKEL